MSSESRPERRSEKERQSESATAPASASASASEAGGGTDRGGAGSATSPAPDSAAPETAASSAAPAYADRCYRSPAALAGGVLLLLLAVWLGTDALLNGTNRTRLTALAGLLFFVPLVVAFTLRPAVYANPQRMRVRNPFRTITVPWGTLESVQSGYSSEFVADGTKYQLWSIPVSLRARKRASRQAERAERNPSKISGPARPVGLFGLGGVPGGADDGTESRAPSDQAIDELRALAQDNGESDAAQGRVVVRWAYEILGPALAGGIALAVVFATS